MALNVIALVSGGKDSFFSMLHCLANGHNVIALANLHPSPHATNPSDTNSYMYQTVGHAVIPLYEQALGIPLYRQEITGTAVNSSRDYAAPASKHEEQDETEDLVPLLRKVMKEHPEANAVASGAILSTYQRTRVESVALRLGLTPLSYLWQYPLLPPYSQTQLLHDMAAVGQEAIVIKTASGGLDERFLGWNVSAPSTISRLQKAMAKFGEESNGAVLGEGGEFETLALDGPRPVWKKRIRIEPGAAGGAEGGQSVLNVRASELEEKSESEDDGAWEARLRIPDLFDDEFKPLLEDPPTTNDTESFTSDAATLLNDPEPIPDAFDKFPLNAASDTPTLFTYSNLSDTARSQSHPASPSRQLTKILLRLDHVLKQWHLSRTQITHCTLLLRSMSDFPILNPLYASYFDYTNPPARVTVAAGSCMPDGVDVMLSITLDKDRVDRKGRVLHAVERQGLHVQGRSYWAPANIGPYSQAISVRLPGDSGVEVVYIAGQIPLIPQSMGVYGARGFRGQVVLSLQHLWRIGRAKGVSAWTCGVGFIPGSGSDGAESGERVRIAQEAWRRIHSSTCWDANSDDEDAEGSVDVDPWDRRNNHAPSFTDTTQRARIPASSSAHADSTPPVFIAQVSSLPRGVDIEWSCTGLTCAPQLSRSPLAPLTITHPPGTGSRFYTLEIGEGEGVDVLRRLGRESVGEWTGAVCYATPGLGVEGLGARGGRGSRGWRGVQWVPCERVWGKGGREVRGVVVGRWDGGLR